eukprot:TRINITY_DN63743_c0_g1_i1.p1 TRINITY_DN63743_c0_g1~~TRINITY_DN63743_c0_g1_i1.p1  ORF type:complete len:178 (+),score=25.78 TRINITY_DN63743_c0_g1_i1:42-536(+)
MQGYYQAVKVAKDVEQRRVKELRAAEVVQLPHLPGACDESLSACDESRMCIACECNSINVAAWPCQHAVLCEACMKEVRMRSGQCPVCREQIKIVYGGTFDADFVNLKPRLERLEHAPRTSTKFSWGRSRTIQDMIKGTASAVRIAWRSSNRVESISPRATASS